MMVKRAEGGTKGGGRYLKRREIPGLLRYMACGEGRNEIVDGNVHGGEPEGGGDDGRGVGETKRKGL
jgi:hypothetical protein